MNGLENMQFPLSKPHPHTFIRTMFTNNKGKVIGNLKDGVFRKKIKGSVHIFRNYDAIGFDKDLAENPNIHEFRVKDIETDTIYTTTQENLLQNGIEGDFDTPQLFLPRKYWNTENAKQPTLI